MSKLHRFYEKNKILPGPADYYQSMFREIQGYRQSQAKMFAWAMENHFFNGVKGNFIEFGTYAGESLALAYHAFHIYMANKVKNLKLTASKPPKLFEMKFYAFDSFEGLPKSSENDHDQRDLQAGDWQCSLMECKKNLEFVGVDLKKINFVKGWYKDTLDKRNQKRIGNVAIVHIDCDHYQSAKRVLDFLSEILLDGAILMFDDWFAYRGRSTFGEQRAFNEWLSENEENFIARQWIPYTANAMSFIINRKS